MIDNLKQIITSALSATAILLPAAPAGAEPVSASGSQGVTLTIYNQNFGVVKDLREVELKQGINQLRFEDVAARIDPTTVSFRSLTAPDAVEVREQNYQYDLINPETILSKSVGKPVKFKQFLPGGQVEELAGVLLNAPQASIADASGNVSVQHQGLVLKTGEGLVLNPAGQVELAELPAGLVSRPSLLWSLDCQKAGTHKTEIAYQTGGLNWRCDYVVVSSGDDSEADITSWVTLENSCGASFKNSSVKLLAGDVHRVQPQPVPQARFGICTAGAAEEQFTEKAFAEYHLYTLKGKTDVNDKETKQLTLFSAGGVPTRKLFIFEPVGPPYWGGWIPPQQNKQKVQVKLEIENNKANHMGMPMPAGKVRVYKRGEDGSLEFIGEDMIDHTPKDEKVRVYVGDAFDLVGERKQLSIQRVSDHVQRGSFEIDLRNHKDTEVTVTAVEHAWGDWKILQSSQPYTKKDAKTFEFAVKVPANGETKVTYEIETKS